MSHDAMNEEQFEGHLYHGTTAELGDHLEPGRRANFSDTEHGYVYATPHLSDAWNYAEKAWHSTSHGHPRVYRVSPTGPVEKDPTRTDSGILRGNYAADVRSQHPFVVHGEEEMPEHMGSPEEWR